MRDDTYEFAAVEVNIEQTLMNNECYCSIHDILGLH